MTFEELLGKIANNKLLLTELDSHDDLDETELCLDDNNISEEQTKSLIKALKSNTTIKTVGTLWVDNHSLEDLLELVKVNKTITNLNFIITYHHNNRFKKSEDLKNKINDYITRNNILAMDCTNKTSIKIIKGTIDIESTKALIQKLKKNPNIYHIDLTETAIHDLNGWKHLFDAYKKGYITASIETNHYPDQDKLNEFSASNLASLASKSMTGLIESLNGNPKKIILYRFPAELQKLAKTRKALQKLDGNIGVITNIAEFLPFPKTKKPEDRSKSAYKTICLFNENIQALRMEIKNQKPTKIQTFVIQ